MSQIELILSRHGETEENKLHIMQGQLPGHLSELGKQQAKALAETLDKEEPVSYTHLTLPTSDLV